MCWPGSQWNQNSGAKTHTSIRPLLSNSVRFTNVYENLAEPNDAHNYENCDTDILSEPLLSNSVRVTHDYENLAFHPPASSDNPAPCLVNPDEVTLTIEQDTLSTEPDADVVDDARPASVPHAHYT